VALLGLLLASSLIAIPLSSAGATVSDRALVLAGTVTGGASSIEATEAAANGLTVDVVDSATWATMTAAQFASYRLIVLGDPTCQSLTADVQAAADNAKTWGPVVNGNVVITGTDPVFHATQGGETLTRRAIDFAAAQTGKTGAYISLSCYYHDTAPNTPVPLLDGIASGGFSVTGVGCYNNAHIVAESPALTGLTDTDLSDWSCSVHEGFQTWPGALVPLAIARDFDSSFTASDGSQGPPYILAGGDIRSFPLSLSPLSGSAPAGGSHTVTAQLLDGTTREPVAAAKIGFRIVSGPNTGRAGTCAPTTCVTTSTGQVSWTYTSNGTAGSDTIQAFYDSNGDASPSPGEPQTTAGMDWTGSGELYQAYWVAMGDSFSSGEGNPPFDAGTDVFSFGRRLDGCHRSSSAWPRQLGVNPVWHLSCSGAKVKDFYSGQEKISPDNVGQIRTLQAIERGLRARGEHVRLVTLTIGGNDIGFADILGDCFFRECLAHFEQNENHVRALRVPVAQLLRQLKANVPGARIVLAGYPRLFPDSQAENVACGWLTPTERIRANTLLAEVNVTLNQAAKDAGATFAFVSDALDGHELCSADSWMFEVDPLVWGNDQRQGHPTLLGQRAIAAVVDAKLRSIPLS
jgi:hypothetical protein